MRHEYDADLKELWVVVTQRDAPLMDKATLLDLGRTRRRGSLPDGRSVSAVSVVFPDRAGAQRNVQPLRFVELGVYVETDGGRKRYTSPEGDVTFDVRSDDDIQ